MGIVDLVTVHERMKVYIGIWSTLFLAEYYSFKKIIMGEISIGSGYFYLQGKERKKQ